MKTFAVMLCLKCLVSSFIDIIGVCHEISTEMFEVDIVSNERVLLNSALKLFVNIQKALLRRTQELDILGRV